MLQFQGSGGKRIFDKMFLKVQFYSTLDIQNFHSFLTVPKSAVPLYVPNSSELGYYIRNAQYLGVSTCSVIL